MIVLIVGLIVFLGIHAVRIVADDWRTQMIAKHGEKTWKGIYSVVSLVGFGLIIWGYILARDNPVPIWDPPIWTRHLAVLFMAISLFLVAQNGNTQGPVSAKIGHPMTAGIIVWSAAHLSANGTLADILLFGSFLVWSLLVFVSARGRDAISGETRAVAGWGADLKPGIVGLVLWAVFIWKVHEWLFGVAPLV